MADPRNELAEIIVPAAPAMATPAGSHLFLCVAGAVLCVACVGLLAWLWHRRRQARALHAIAAAAAQQQGTPPIMLASQLDAWARKSFQLARVDATRCPPGVDSGVWSDWAKTLEHLRFAPPRPDGYAVLVGLCERARTWRPHA